jgi:hypothetical protein
MIYHGKQLYLKDLLLPDYTDAEKWDILQTNCLVSGKMRVICGVIL